MPDMSFLLLACPFLRDILDLIFEKTSRPGLSLEVISLSQTMNLSRVKNTTKRHAEMITDI